MVVVVVELVDMLCYVGDMLSVDGDADAVMQLWRLEYIRDGISSDN